MIRPILSVALLLTLGGCSRAPDSPTVGSRGSAVMVQSQTQPISVEKISKDVVGRVVEITELAGDGTPTKWTFEADEFRQVQILEESVSGAAATIVIAMTTRNNPGPEDDAVQVSGKLRLHYELRQGEWTLKDIENLAFQYTVGIEA